MRGIVVLVTCNECEPSHDDWVVEVKDYHAAKKMMQPSKTSCKIVVS